MLELSPTTWIAVALTFAVAGAVKGVTGMGLPTVAMGVLGAVMPPVAAASLLLAPSFVTNAWQLATGPSATARLRRLWPMMLGITVGTIAGAQLLASGDARWTTVGLGAALVAYAVSSLSRPIPAVPARAERWLSPAIGLATGAVTGGTGVFVIPAVPYLQALGLGKDDLAQALGLSFTTSTIALGIGLAARGAFHAEHLGASALAIVPALLGMWAGTALRRRIPAAAFRRWFLVCLALLGVELVARALA